MRTRTCWLAVVVVGFAATTGCRPFHRYLERRTRDAADCLKLEVGVGAPIYARAKVTDFAVVGAGYAITSRYGLNGRPNVLDRAAIDRTPGRTRLTGEMGIPLIVNDEWGEDHAVTTWGPCVTRRECGRCPDRGPGSRFARKFWVSGAGSLLLSARAGVNPIEALDFVTGWFAWDLLGDDDAVGEFLEMAFKGKAAHVADLLNRTPSLANASDARGRKALHWAASWPNSPGHLEVIKLLAARSAELNTADDLGITPLHLAATPHRGTFDTHLAAARLLIGNGAKVNIAAKDGSTPLHQAAAASAPRIVSLLLENGAEVNARDAQGRTPLALTDELHGGTVAEVLIKKGGRR
jgi:hypothetical protein